ncbi:hypothetical protein NYF23_05785 [SAR92 clade bacterium H455]|uniref:Uncharacterized protein n=1 Tax=SAR92 clade bacterium H455 TaxID=2974818 RepID=A0ABY5TTW0_9GAMM|nr:hypothetical protein NYF23_05785 [SAR92 clade bacterium H455]
MIPYIFRALFLLLNFGLMYLVLKVPENLVFYQALEIITLSTFFSLACQFGSGNLFKTLRSGQLGRREVVYACYFSLLLNLVFSGTYYVVFEQDAMVTAAVFSLTQLNLSSTFVGHYFRVNNRFNRFVLFSSWASPFFTIAYILLEDLGLTVFLMVLLTSGVLLTAHSLTQVNVDKKFHIRERVYLFASQVMMAGVAVFIVENALIVGSAYFSAHNLQIFIRLLQSSPSIQSFIDIKMWNRISSIADERAHRINSLVIMHSAYGILWGFILCTNISLGAVLLAICLTLIICLAFLNVGLTYLYQYTFVKQVMFICLGVAVAFSALWAGDGSTDVASVYRFGALLFALLLFRFAQKRLLLLGNVDNK